MQRTCSTRGFAREESPKAAGWRLPGGLRSPGNTETAGKQQKRIEMTEIGSGKQVKVPDRAQKDKPKCPSQWRDCKGLCAKVLRPVSTLDCCLWRRDRTSPGARPVGQAISRSSRQTIRTYVRRHRRRQRHRRRPALRGSRRAAGTNSSVVARVKQRHVALPCRHAAAPGTDF